MFNGLLNFSFKEVAIGILLSAILLGGGVAAIVAFVPRTTGGEVAPPTSPTPPSEVVTPSEPTMPEPDMSEDSDMVTAPTVMMDSELPCTPFPSCVDVAIQPVVFFEYVGQNQPFRAFFLRLLDPISFDPITGTVSVKVSLTGDGLATFENGKTTIDLVFDEIIDFVLMINELKETSQQEEIKIKVTSNDPLVKIFAFESNFTVVRRPHKLGVVIDNPEIGGVALSDCEPNCITNRDVDETTIIPHPSDDYVFSHWECETVAGDPAKTCLFNYRVAYNKDYETSTITSQSPLLLLFRHEPYPYYYEPPSVTNTGIIKIRPVFRYSPGTVHQPLEINLPNGMELPNETYYYAVNISDTVKIADKSVYNRIAEYSFNAWSELNPHLTFVEVDIDDERLNLTVSYVDHVLRFLGIDDGSGSTPVGLGGGGTIIVLSNARRINNETQFCRQHGRDAGLFLTTTVVTMHEIGHVLGLGHHPFASHLLSGSAGNFPFDNKFLNIPDYPYNTAGYTTQNLYLTNQEYEAETDEVIRRCAPLSENTHDHSHPHSHPHP